LIGNDNVIVKFYVNFSVTAPGIKLAGVSDLQFKVKVTTKIFLINVELGTAERESVGGALKKYEKFFGFPYSSQFAIFVLFCL